MTRVATLALSIMVCSCSVLPKNTRENSLEAWFIRQSPSYYPNLAHACDEVLQAQPQPNDVLFFVSLRERSLPKLIIDLHPRELVLTSTSVSFVYPHGNEGFWIGWGPGEADTNVWTLDANLKEGRKTFYAETRKPKN